MGGEVFENGRRAGPWDMRLARNILPYEVQDSGSVDYSPGSRRGSRASGGASRNARSLLHIVAVR